MDRDAAPATNQVMPRGTPFQPLHGEAPASIEERKSKAAAVSERGDRSGVFGHLVHDDGDIAGLVAYSIYKQHKLDWLRAFEAAMGRAPDEDELASYIIGEGTPRRLATYRHLAEATLAGQGPEIDGGASPAARPAVAARRFDGRIGGYSTGLVMLYGAIALLFVIGFYLALHYTATSR